MGQEELSIAQRVHQGHLPGELGAAVRIEPDQIQPGYFNVQGKGFRYRMHPVATSTGAIRLEDKQAGAVWLQLANKSMLMDQKKGQRVADECAHPEQMAFAAQMKNNPPPPLIEVNTGRGFFDFVRPEKKPCCKPPVNTSPNARPWASPRWRWTPSRSTAGSARCSC